jgi:hypothetical protein
MEFPLLTNLKGDYSIYEAPPDLVTEVQTALAAGNYYPVNAIDGKAGSLTVQAFFAFKEDCKLSHQEFIGQMTAQKLVELATKRQGTPEASEKLDQTANKDAGTRTGNSMRLPDGSIVYANEFMAPYITWGETTKDCTRVPSENFEVRNGLELANQFAKVRENFGSPLAITSGFRPAAINRACGGVSNSQHIPFKALDMYPLNGDFQKLWQVLKDSDFGGLGDGVSTGKGFYHADTREDRVIFGY